MNSTRKMKISVSVDPSTARWLNALARSQPLGRRRGNRRSLRHAQAGDLLAQAAFCLADCAGRREGSWEADVARSLLVSSGFVSSASERDRERLHSMDERERRRWRDNESKAKPHADGMAMGSGAVAG